MQHRRGFLKQMPPKDDYPNTAKRALIKQGVKALLQRIFLRFKPNHDSQQARTQMPEKRQYHNTLTYYEEQLWVFWAKDAHDFDVEIWQSLKSNTPNCHIHFYEVFTQDDYRLIQNRIYAERWNIVGVLTHTRITSYNRLVFEKHEVTPIRD
jgi:hypothetical protein